MNEEAKKLKQLIDSSQHILITSHIGPDGDSISSSLLLFQVLKLNYSDKTITVSMEEQAYGLGFLEGYEEIVFKPLRSSLENAKPDLLIILDANSVNRLTRDSEGARDYLAKHPAKVAIIDHHEPVGVEDNDLYINNSSPAVTLDVYEITEQLGYKKPDNYAQTAMTGIYTDTGGFINRNLNFEKTFSTVPKLMADGADLETLANNLKAISEDGVRVLKEFVDNLRWTNEYTFSFLSDETTSRNDHDNLEAIKQAADIIRGELLRNVDNKKWGFIVYRDALASKLTYSVSFRALTGGEDVSKIAARLGGGGHKPAAGAKFEAGSIDEAMRKVKEAINS